MIPLCGSAAADRRQTCSVAPSGWGSMTALETGSSAPSPIVLEAPKHQRLSLQLILGSFAQRRRHSTAIDIEPLLFGERIGADRVDGLLPVDNDATSLLRQYL